MIPKSSLIVSCQAPVDSPLHDPTVISKMAAAAVKRGAKGVRIDSPSHVKAVREVLPESPIIGLWKRQFTEYDVYITPRCQDIEAIADAGADIIAIDATKRKRPHLETVSQLIDTIHQLDKLVMADIDTVENAIASVEAGADLVATTLYGYTAETNHLPPPGFELLEELVKTVDIPIICEGGIATPTMAEKALQLGAYAVVVGTAITGIDLNVTAFNSVFPQ